VENLSENLFFKVIETGLFWKEMPSGAFFFSGRRKVPWDLDLLRIT